MIAITYAQTIRIEFDENMLNLTKQLSELIKQLAKNSVAQTFFYRIELKLSEMEWNLPQIVGRECRMGDQNGQRLHNDFNIDDATMGVIYHKGY